MVVYTWEGNPTNISCEVKAHPGASVLWFREDVQLPSANYTNMKIYNTPTTSFLEVRCTLNYDDNEQTAPVVWGHARCHI